MALFDVIETVDRDKIAAELAREIARQGRSPTLYVQVNTGSEPQKAGIEPRETVAFVARCRDDARPRDRRADVHSAGRRESGAAFRAAGEAGAGGRRRKAVDGHVRRLRACRSPSARPASGSARRSSAADEPRLGERHNMNWSTAARNGTLVGTRATRSQRGPQTITLRGKTRAVVLSAEDYDKLASSRPVAGRPFAERSCQGRRIHRSGQSSSARRQAATSRSEARGLQQYRQLRNRRALVAPMCGRHLVQCTRSRRRRMRYNQLGNTRRCSSRELCLGTMTFGARADRKRPLWGQHRQRRAGWRPTRIVDALARRRRQLLRHGRCLFLRRVGTDSRPVD